MMLDPITLNTTPKDPLRARHEAWVIDAAIKGWTYGPEIDIENKKHPQMVLFDELMAGLKRAHEHN